MGTDRVTDGGTDNYNLKFHFPKLDYSSKENIHSVRKQKKSLRGKTLREGIIVWKGGRTLKVNMRSSDLKINM